MLHLASRTSESWVDWALASLDEVLLDHAHCEKKAASTAVSLLFRYPQHATLLIPLSRLAREELAHFEEVLDHLARRDVPFCRQRPSPYAAELMKAVRAHEPSRLLDTLLCCALIEARSCERMQLLSLGLENVDSRLAKMYRGLLACEARHHDTYVDLARSLELIPERDLRLRLQALALHECEVLANSPDVPRLHNRP